MFSQLLKNIFKETTNVRDISPVTFNSPGTYDPRYGKSKVTFVGRGGSGSYTSGNYVGATENGYWNGSYFNGSNQNSPNLSNVYMSSVSFNAVLNVTDATNSNFVASFNAISGSMGPQSGYGATSSSGGWYVNYLFTTNSNWTITYDGAGHSSIVFSPASSSSATANGYYTQSISVSSASAVGAVITPAAAGSWNTGSWNTSTFVSTGYNTAYTNASSTNTGSSYTFDGISVPGGYGGVASVIAPVSLPYQKLWVSRTVTIPSGGYATLTFSI